MDMVTIIKNSLGKEVTNKLTGEVGHIGSVKENHGELEIGVSVNDEVEILNFIQFVSKYNLDFSL